MNPLLKKALPHAIAVVVFIAAASMYFYPCFQGMDLDQADIKKHKGMSKEIFDVRETEGEGPLWTNSMFGGMPAYQIGVEHKSNWVRVIDKVAKLGLPRPVGTLFMCMLGFYILCMCLRIHPAIGIAGGLAFGFATISILYLSAGHASKVDAIAYMAPVLGGVLLTFSGRWKLGGAVTALFLALHLTANHLQMTYYLVFLVGLVGLGEVIRLAVQKNFGLLLKSVAILVVAALFAVLPTTSNLLTTFEYSEYSTRGSTELTATAPGANPEESKVNDGLDPNYIHEYSFARGEIFSVVIPNAKGGNSRAFATDDKDAVKDLDITKQQKEQLLGSNVYWGEQRSTGGAFYFGAAIIFLFIMGLIFIRHWAKWPLLIMVILSCVLSWKYGGGISEFFMESVPGYAKFRDTKMILVTFMIIAPLCAVWFLDSFRDREWVEASKKKLMIAGGSVFLLFSIVAITPATFFSFLNTGDQDSWDYNIETLREQVQIEKDKNPAQSAELDRIFAERSDEIDMIFEGLQEARVTVFQEDAMRSLAFMLLAAGILFLVMRNKGLIQYAGIALAAVVLMDQVPVNLRYVHHEYSKVKGPDGKRKLEKYIDKDLKRFPYSPSPADLAVLASETREDAELAEAVESGKDAYAEKFNSRNKLAKANIESAGAFGALTLNSNYRVAKLTAPTSDGETPYFHKSITGYHGAKLKRFQELLDWYIGGEYNVLAQIIQQFPEQARQAVEFNLGTMKILNMLNARYIIFDPGQEPVRNYMAQGNCWFVNEVVLVDSANIEMRKLAELDLRTQAVVDSRFADLLPANVSIDSTAVIEMTEYHPEHLVYSSSSAKEQVAIFSEMYYPEGWTATIDGQQAEFFRANYALRGLVIPAGETTVEFTFAPSSYATGSTLSLVGSILLLLLIGGLAFLDRRETQAGVS